MQLVTTILTVFKRPDLLDIQIKRLQEQTISTDIWIDITVNEITNSDKVSEIINKYPNYRYNIHWNQNLYHIGRFYYAMNVQTDFVFILDDDQLPGKNYIKHCIDTQKKIGDSILTGYGVILNRNDGYYSNISYGWQSVGLREIENEIPMEVDMAGHSWFFPKRVTKYITYEDPPSIKNGEDLHFSYTCQKYGNVPVFVASHMKNSPENWSSSPTHSMSFGNDSVATWRLSNHQPLRHEAVRQYVSNGWKLVKFK